MSDLAGQGRDALAAWREGQAQSREAARRQGEAFIEGWSALVLVATLLYVMIGHTPYDHQLTFDPLTGGALISPVNRYIWLGLLAAAAPVLIARYEALPAFALRLWPLLLLFAWFAATSTWALDPAASQRRLFLTVVGLLICIAVRLGLPDGRKMHAAMAWACAIVIFIDLGSWIVAPEASMTDLGLAAIHNHKNTLGAVMLFSSLVIAPYALGRPTRGGRLFWGAVLLGGLVLLVASLSKTSIALTAVAALIAPLLLAVAGLRDSLVRAVLASLLVLLIAAGFLWLAKCLVEGRDPLWPIEQLNFTHRTDVWSFVLQQSAHHPVKGFGFGSFWDIDPAVQPSKQTDLWFAKPDAPTNEAHNGYLDLLVTTGFPGLIGALILLFGWVLGGLAMIRRARQAAGAAGRADLPFALFLGLFPVMFFIHNWMESTYFTPDSPYGLIIVLVGVAIDMRERSYPTPAPARG
jgi:exopolysaccharide production protein ExoQ